MKLYNVLSQSAEKFVPLEDVVTVYVCGITPYDTTHLERVDGKADQTRWYPSAKVWRHTKEQAEKGALTATVLPAPGGFEPSRAGF